MCQNYASAEPMLPGSIGPVQAQFWHIHDMFTKIRFTINYLMTYPVIMISFDNDIFDNHFYIQLMMRTTTCLNTLPAWDGFRVILIFHYTPLQRGPCLSGQPGMQVSHDHQHERVVSIQNFLTLTYIPQPWHCNKIDRIWHILLWTCHCHFIQHHALHWYLTCIFISALSLYLC